MTTRNPLVLVPGGNPQIQELPAGDVLGGAAQGPAGTITVGTVTTGAAGSSVSVTNSGTSSEAILNFTIPRGDTGATGAGGALTLVEQHTASSSATLDFTSISSTYDNYIFKFINIQPATNTANFVMRMATGAGPTYDSGANYFWASFVSSPTGSSAVGSTGDTSIELAVSLDSTATLSCVGSAELYDPANTSVHKRIILQTFYPHSSGTNSQRTGGGSYKSTTAVTAVRFLMSSGNIAAGTIRMYGVAKT